MNEIPDRLRAALADRYHLLEPLGEGGMATVYLADDLKHDRKVAVKVLRPELAAVIGGERFLAEIKTTAALQHPHILPLFDSGEADSYLYYVMPFVEGESLRKRIDRERQLEVDEAVRVARAVASALQYAHDRDIIHRDIKPENILLHAGEPVVADFGIALAISAAGGGRMTETGLSLGTPHYMSPEQAAADRDLSARSDVYSLACVLYEMLSGQPPHTGPTAQSILVRILTEDPRPVSDFRPTVPRHLRAVIAKGLEKLPADRFKSADELKAAIDDESFSYERVQRTGPVAGVGQPAQAAPTSAIHRLLGSPLHAATTALLAVATLWLALGNRGGGANGAGDGPVLSFVAADSANGIQDVAIGPDGTVVYLQGLDLFVRPAGALEAARLEGPERVQFMALSPDGTWIAYIVFDGTASVMRKIQVTGGPIANVWTGEQQLAVRPHWGEDGWIYFAGGTNIPDRLRRVPDVGGETEDLLDSNVGFVLDPFLLPGGKSVVYTATNAGQTEPRIMRLDIESRDTIQILVDGFSPRWSPTGHLLYGHAGGALWAVPFDPDRGEPTGAAAPVLEGLRAGLSMAEYALNAGGSLVYVSGAGASPGATGGTYFALVDEEGRRETLPIEPTDHPDARISPDGRSLAYIRAGDTWVFDLDRGSDIPLTEGGTGGHNPIWSPDGTEIAYRSGDDVMRRRVDRSSEAVPVTSTEDPDNPTVWLEDGTLILGTEGARNGDLLAVDVNSDAPPRRLLDANWQERGAAVSPDGRWIAYSSGRSGAPQLYVRTWPELLDETLVSGGEEPLFGAMYPQWSSDSRTIYYQQGFTIHAADLSTDGGLEVIGRRELPIEMTGGLLQDIHPDGRLLVTSPAERSSNEEEEEAAPQRLIVSTSWPTELRRRLGGGS